MNEVQGLEGNFICMEAKVRLGPHFERVVLLSAQQFLADKFPAQLDLQQLVGPRARRTSHDVAKGPQQRSMVEGNNWDRDLAVAGVVTARRSRHRPQWGRKVQDIRNGLPKLAKARIGHQFLAASADEGSLPRGAFHDAPPVQTDEERFRRWPTGHHWRNLVVEDHQVLTQLRRWIKHV